MSRRRTRNRAIYNKPKIASAITPPVIKSKTLKSRVKNIWKKISPTGKVVLGGLFILGSGVLTYTQLWDRFFPKKENDIKEETTKEKYEKENFDTGHLVGPKVITFKNYKPEQPINIESKPLIDTLPPIPGILVKDLEKTGLVISFGSSQRFFTAEACYNGIDVIATSLIGYGSIETPKLFLGVKNERLYVSVKFNDIESEQNIGTIEFNYWRVFLPNLLSYNYDDQRLEVQDRKGNIVFSIRYQEATANSKPTVELNGYLISKESILVFANSGNYSFIPKSVKGWKKEALERIENIKSIF